MLKKIVILTGFAILGLVSFSFGQNKEIVKCETKEKKGKYKLVDEWRALDEDGTISVLIVIDKKNFRKNYMLQVAKRLKSVYCNDEFFLVEIFDSRKKALDPERFQDPLSKNNPPRGTYWLNEKLKKEILRFTDDKGKTIEIDLNTLEEL